MKLRFINILLAGIALGGCNDISYAPDEPKVSVTITASIADGEAQSRTCIDTENMGKGYIGVKWHEGDKIGVYGDGSTVNACFTSKSGGKTAEFAGEMIDKPKHAYYPYSDVNDGKAVNALIGNLPEEQPYDEKGTLTGDYKYGEPVSGKTNEFVFQHLFSMLRVTVDANNTDLKGEALESIKLTFTDGDGKERLVNGKFTFSAIDGSYSNVTDGTNKVSMPWEHQPKLDAELMGFVTVMPTVKQGDKIAVEVVTSGHRVTFSAVCQANFEKECVYNIPLTLANYAAQADKFSYKVTEHPAISAFSFLVANNQGKLLDKQISWATSWISQGPETSEVKQLDAAINGKEITLTIPYLYNFNLVPTFKASTGATVTVGNVAQTSGVTAVNFTQPVTYKVALDGDVREYTVKITNTGLPIVVIQQSSSGDFTRRWDGITIVNQFVDFMIRGKDTEFVSDDQITIYKADGNVDMETALGGVRLRGNTSQKYPKKPLAIKFVDKQTVLGMQKHKRWVLLANWLDHSMIRNAVAFDIAHAIENSWRANESIGAGVPWTVHGQSVELIIDGRHMGNYYLCEQIKIGGKRLNIQDSYEDVVASGAIPTFETCGYLMELDTNLDEKYSWETDNRVPFMLKDSELPADYLSMIKNKVQNIENLIDAGEFAEAYKHLDINSVIDQWLVWELAMNHEMLDPRSVYYYMDGDGPLSAASVWDFDRATFQNYEKAQSMGSSGDRLKAYDAWICNSASSETGTCVWMPQLIKNPTFQAKVKERWAAMYPYLQQIPNQIRQYGEQLAGSYSYDSKMWPTNKSAIQAYKSGFSDWSGDEEIADWNAVIDNFVQCYERRLAGMNGLVNSFISK